MTTPYTVINGDSHIVLTDMSENHFDSIVTDPPYGLTSITDRFGKEGSAPAQHGTDGAFARASKGFMGQTWDGQGIERDPTFWREVWRVLKPGGHLLAFGGTRTAHRIVSAIEDAGFEVRDSIFASGLCAWVYGSGFPKSHDVSKGIDRHLGAERPVVGQSSKQAAGFIRHGRTTEECWMGTDDNRTPALLTDPATEEAETWDGWGSALKPSHEPIALCQKPLSEGSIAANVLRWGVGGLNIGGCRVDGAKDWPSSRNYGPGQKQPGGKGQTQSIPFSDDGRWPPNTLLIHHPLCQPLGTRSTPGKSRDTHSPNNHAGTRLQNSATKHQFDYAGEGEIVYQCHADCFVAALEQQGGSPRFFPQFSYEPADMAPFLYCPKADRRERDAGLYGTAVTKCGVGALRDGNRGKQAANIHPTVKPAAAMQWLCRLITPPNGLILDPFCGSGTTGIAALREGFRFTGIEQSSEYAAIATARIEHERQRGRQLSLLEEAS